MLASSSKNNPDTDRADTAYRRFCLLAIAASEMPESTKRLLAFIVRSRLVEFSFGVGTIAKKLGCSERTAQYAIRDLQAAGVLTLKHKERFSKRPRVYVVGNVSQALRGADWGAIRGAITGAEKRAKKAPDVLGANCTPELHRISNTSGVVSSQDAQQPPANISSPLPDAEAVEAALATSEWTEASSLIRSFMAGGL
jgi:hypothetical protein